MTLERNINSIRQRENDLRRPQFPVINNVIDLSTGELIGNNLVYNMLVQKDSWLWILYGEAGMGKTRFFKEWKDRALLMQEELGIKRPIRFHNMASILDQARTDMPWLKRPFQTDEEVGAFSDFLNTSIMPIKSGEAALLEIPHSRADYTLIDAAHGLVHPYRKKANIIGFIGAPSIQEREVESRRRKLQQDPRTIPGTDIRLSKYSIGFSRGSSIGGLGPEEIIEKRAEIFAKAWNILENKIEWDLDNIEIPKGFGPLTIKERIETKLRIVEMGDTFEEVKVPEKKVSMLLNPDLSIRAA
jgi:hypothetical protein